MNTLRYVLAVILGWICGSAVNFGLVQLGHQNYTLEGTELNDMEQLAAIMPTLDWQFFIFPFLAHALGTLSGALVAGVIAPSKKIIFALVIGVLFLVGGIVVNIVLPGPGWFIAVDIVIAYIPMAWIGGKVAQKLSAKT